MGKKLSIDEIRAIEHEHVECERRFDLDGTMATVSQNPQWEFYPLGLVVTGREAVREMYRLQFERLYPHLLGRREVHVAFGDNCLAFEVAVDFRMAGKDRTEHMMAFLTFDTSGMSSEAIFFGACLNELVTSTFVGAFLQLPGVKTTGGTISG